MASRSAGGDPRGSVAARAARNRDRLHRRVLALVDLGRFAQDRARDLGEVAVVFIDALADIFVPSIDTDAKAYPRAQSEHTRENLAQRPLMPATELRDRRVIRHQVAGHDAISDVLQFGSA